MRRIPVLQVAILGLGLAVAAACGGGGAGAVSVPDFAVGTFRGSFTREPVSLVMHCGRDATCQAVLTDSVSIIAQGTGSIDGSAMVDIALEGGAGTARLTGRIDAETGATLNSAGAIVFVNAVIPKAAGEGQNIFAGSKSVVLSGLTAGSASFTVAGNGSVSGTFQLGELAPQELSGSVSPTGRVSLAGPSDFSMTGDFFFGPSSSGGFGTWSLLPDASGTWTLEGS